MAHATARNDRPHSLIASLRGIVDGWRQDLARHREFTRIRRELSVLSDRELADIGLSRAQVVDVARKATARA